MTVLIILLTTLVLTVFLFAVATRPRWFWPLLICGGVLTSGLMPLGFNGFDELFLASLLLGAFMGITVAENGGATSKEWVSSGALHRVHRIVFFAFIFYVLFQCFRGIIVLESPRKLRWIFFFLILGGLTHLSANIRFAVPSPRKLAFLVTLVSIIYFGTYLLYGVIATVFGVDKHDIQYAQTQSLFAIWGTTAYVLYPIIISIPGALTILRDGEFRYRLSAWLSLGVLTSATFFYDSRVSVLVIFSFGLLGIPMIGFRRTMVGAGAVSILLGCFFVYWGNRDLDFFVQDNFGLFSRVLEADVERAPSPDSDRMIWAKSALLGIGENWNEFLFGHGFRTSGIVVAPTVKALFESIGIHKNHEEDVSTPAFTNLTVDLGAVGFSMLLLCGLLTGVQIWRGSGRNRLVLISAVGLSFAWLFVINIVDVMLFYLMIMPSGPLIQMSKAMPPDSLMGTPKRLA